MCGSDRGAGYSTGMTAPSLDQATVLDPGGTAHTLSSLWAERPAVLVFLRHYG